MATLNEKQILENHGEEREVTLTQRFEDSKLRKQLGTLPALVHADRKKLVQRVGVEVKAFKKDATTCGKLKRVKDLRRFYIEGTEGYEAFKSYVERKGDASKDSAKQLALLQTLFKMEDKLMEKKLTGKKLIAYQSMLDKLLNGKGYYFGDEKALKKALEKLVVKGLKGHIEALNLEIDGGLDRALTIVATSLRRDIPSLVIEECKASGMFPRALQKELEKPRVKQPPVQWFWTPGTRVYPSFQAFLAQSKYGEAFLEIITLEKLLAQGEEDAYKAGVVAFRNKYVGCGKTVRLFSDRKLAFRGTSKWCVP